MEPRKKRRGEPPDGTPLGFLAGFADGDATAIDYRHDGRTFPMLLFRRGHAIRLYLNACPHNGLPLTFRSPSIVSADGTRLLCSNHGAQFSVDDGRALACIADDCALITIPAHIDPAGQVVVGPA
jgi:nitrite reductase/ring-hydroxylating ferredoxin subunit